MSRTVHAAPAHSGVCVFWLRGGGGSEGGGGRGKMAASSLEQKLSRLEAKLKQENREARRRIDLNLEISPARARPSKRGFMGGFKGEVPPAWMTRACLERCLGASGVGGGEMSCKGPRR